MTDKSSDKFLAVIDKMLKTVDQVTEIIKVDNEYYFRYAGHAFSVTKRSAADRYGRYTFYVYPQWPDSKSIEELAKIFESLGPDTSVPVMAPYHEAEVSEAARQKFADLHAAVAAKYLRVDEIFDEILDAP